MNEGSNRDLLFERRGLPEDLRFLIERYPRETWRRPGSLSAMARFWLQRHAFFRELGGQLSASIAALREEDFDPRQFSEWFAPRLHHLLSDLEAHHSIEDAHYFPMFRAAEPRLRRGFEILDSDHHLIHGLLEENAIAARRFLEGLEKGGDAMLFAAEIYGRQADRLVAGLMRHLEDEEDLIIPMMLGRVVDEQALS